MIALFMSIAGTLGLTGRWQRVAGWLLALAGLVLAIAALWAVHGKWVASRERAAVAADRAAGTIDAQGRMITADRAAGAARRARDDAFDNQQRELEDLADAPIVDDNRTGLDAVLDGMRRHAAPAQPASAARH